MGSQTSAWGRISAPVSWVTSVCVCVRNRGGWSISASTAYENPMLWFISHRWEWKWRWIASCLLTALVQLFSCLDQMLSACTTLSPCFLAVVPLAQDTAWPWQAWGLRPAIRCLGVGTHMLGQRILSISDTSTLDIGCIHTELLSGPASPSTFRNYIISSNTEQLEPWSCL